MEENLTGSSAAQGWLFCIQGFENYSILCASQMGFGGEKNSSPPYPF